MLFGIVFGFITFAYRGRANFFNLFIELFLFNDIANITTITNACDIWRSKDSDFASVLR